MAYGQSKDVAGNPTCAPVPGPKRVVKGDTTCEKPAGKNPRRQRRGG